MKQISAYLSIALSLFIMACEGPAGLDGYDGRNGENGIDGSIFEAAAFEIETNLVLNTALNRYELEPEQYPSDISLIADDVVLIYRLEEVTDGLDVWRQLPQPFLLDEGILFYNFDFTMNDYNIIVEPDFDASLVPSDLVINQVFRIVVIPADLGTSSKLDTSNLSAVLSNLNISEIKKIQLD